MERAETARVKIEELEGEIEKRKGKEKAAAPPAGGLPAVEAAAKAEPKRPEQPDIARKINDELTALGAEKAKVEALEHKARKSGDIKGAEEHKRTLERIEKTQMDLEDQRARAIMARRVARVVIPPGRIPGGADGDFHSGVRGFGRRMTGEAAELAGLEETSKGRVSARAQKFGKEIHEVAIKAGLNAFPPEEIARRFPGKSLKDWMKDPVFKHLKPEQFFTKQELLQQRLIDRENDRRAVQKKRQDDLIKRENDRRAAQREKQREMIRKENEAIKARHDAGVRHRERVEQEARKMRENRVAKAQQDLQDVLDRAIPKKPIVVIAPEPAGPRL
jgi:hypothetical protein